MSPHRNAKEERISQEEKKRLRMMGCIPDREYSNTFQVRVITRNGRISAEEYRAISEAVDRYGSGSVRISSQVTVDIRGVAYDQLNPLVDFLAGHGLMTGGTGPGIKPIMACNGTNCRYGLADTLGLADKLHDRIYAVWKGIPLPHKFKIILGGCPNHCMQPDLADLGIVGQKIPLVHEEDCRACTGCQVEAVCPAGAVKRETICPEGAVKREKTRIQVDTMSCIHCGRCLDTCPFGVFEKCRQGYQVMIGGHGGRKTVQARPLGKIISSEKALMALVEEALHLYQKEGLSGERFADTIDRLGFETVEAILLHSCESKKPAWKAGSRDDLALDEDQPMQG